MLLRDVMMPLPMREGRGEEMEWPYPGVPATPVAEFAGHRVAALPFFCPETVTTDHGSSYKNHHLVEAERTLGRNILPARTLRPTDKFAVERAFPAINALLLEQLPGFTGADVADRGASPEADAVLSTERMEHLIATWVVAIRQNRILGEYAPAWGAGEDHSPNSLFAAAISQGGFALRIPEATLYHRLLKAHHVKVHPRRGVKIGGLWYHEPVLDDPRFHLPSARGGRRKSKWVVSGSSDAFEHHIDHLNRPAVDRNERRRLRWDTPPPSAVASATLLEAADTMINLEQGEFRDALTTMLHAGPRTTAVSWGRIRAHLGSRASSYQRREFEPAQTNLPGARALLRGPKAGRRGARCLPENIPQRLPDSWRGPLPATTRTRHLLACRAVAVRMVQPASDMDVGEATDFLGTPHAWLLTDERHPRRRLPRDLFAYDGALPPIVAALDAASGLIDYRRRRTSLRGWTLPTRTCRRRCCAERRAGRRCGCARTRLRCRRRTHPWRWACCSSRSRPPGCSRPAGAAVGQPARG